MFANCYCNVCLLPMYSIKPVDGQNRCSKTCREIAAIPSVKKGMRERWSEDSKHGRIYIARSSGVRPVSDCFRWLKLQRL